MIGGVNCSYNGHGMAKVNILGGIRKVSKTQNLGEHTPICAENW